MTALTTAEANNLATLEQTIEGGMQSFLQVGEALWKIREGKLYRQSHDTFEAYCRERWNISKSRAYRLMEASEVAEKLPMGDQITNERQARELSRVEPERRAEVLTKAKNDAPTAIPVMTADERRRALIQQGRAESANLPPQPIPDANNGDTRADGPESLPEPFPAFQPPPGTPANDFYRP